MSLAPRYVENPLTAWALTTGEDGMRSQARGLANAVADVVVEKFAPRTNLFDWFPGRAPPGFSDQFAPPWPDLLVSCGRRSVPYALAVKRASRGQTRIVHVQDPRAFRNRFDLIVAMEHDRLAEGPKVMKIATALHDVTPKSLRDAAHVWRGRLQVLGTPLAGVAVGGDLRGRPFTRADGEALLAGLKRLRQGGVALAVTPSRRTPGPVLALLNQAFQDDAGVYIWDLQGENPYRGILALADRLVVTTDSVSMVSEAIATGHPVELFDLDFPRHRGFVARLVEQNLARRFDGDPEPPWPAAGVKPLESTERVAKRVRALVQSRTGLSG